MDESCCLKSTGTAGALTGESPVPPDHGGALMLHVGRYDTGERFVSVITHELRNMLMVIFGNLELAQRRPRVWLDDALAEHHANIHAAGERILALIGSFSAWQRALPGVSGTGVLDLEALVAMQVGIWRALLPQDIELRFHVLSGVPALTVDAVSGIRMVHALLENAAEAVGHQGRIMVELLWQDHAGELCASCGKAFSGGHVVLRVRDNGMGVSSEQIPKLFLPFFSTRKNGVGVGLGLCIVHEIMHELGGHVLLQSQPNANTTVELLFPHSPDEERRGKGAP